MAKEQVRRRWIGVDVGKSVIDVAMGVRGPIDRIERSKVALECWAQTLGAGTRVVIEATGGYERAIVEALGEQGIEVCIVNPRQVRDFAKASGQLAKTDRLDARILAHFGEAGPRPSDLAAIPPRTRLLLVARDLFSGNHDLGELEADSGPLDTNVWSGAIEGGSPPSTHDVWLAKGSHRGLIHDLRRLVRHEGRVADEDAEVSALLQHGSVRLHSSMSASS